ncbi:MAG: lytic murein transglycosylase B [Pseudomonadales bacterium]
MNRLIGMGTVLVLCALVPAGSVLADYADRADVRAYVDEVSREHGFDPAQLLALFRAAERQEKILESIARPAERTLAWHEYRDIFLKEPRISQGVAFWAANEAALTRAESVYGVAPEYVVAILGVETRYGRVTGSYRVLDALSTLAFDYPPRAAFFRKELTQYLLLAREEGRDPVGFTGSYAGAMGYGQFIPSSYRAYAVDFDGDGARDIWADETDVIGSVANYFRRNGWAPGGPVAVQVEAAGTEAARVAGETPDLGRTVGELEALGVHVDGLAPEQPAGLYRMQVADGDEYWLGLNNFYVITRYNRSSLYALAVHELSQAIVEARRADNGPAAE